MKKQNNAQEYGFYKIGSRPAFELRWRRFCHELAIDDLPRVSLHLVHCLAEMHGQETCSEQLNLSVVCIVRQTVYCQSNS